MGKHIHRKHAVGMNAIHEHNIRNAITTGDGARLDFALSAITGTRRALRQRAALIVTEFMRAGGELPLPDIQPPAARPVSSNAILQSDAL